MLPLLAVLSSGRGLGMVHWQLRMAQQRVLAPQYLHCANTAPECCQHSALLCLSVSPASFPLSGERCGKEWWYPLSSSLQHSGTLHGDTAGRGQGIPSPGRDAFLTTLHWFPRQGTVGSSAQHHPHCEHFLSGIYIGTHCPQGSLASIGSADPSFSPTLHSELSGCCRCPSLVHLAAQLTGDNQTKSPPSSQSRRWGSEPGCPDQVATSLHIPPVPLGDDTAALSAAGEAPAAAAPPAIFMPLALGWLVQGDSVEGVG